MTGNWRRPYQGDVTRLVLPLSCVTGRPAQLRQNSFPFHPPIPPRKLCPLKPSGTTQREPSKRPRDSPPVPNPHNLWPLRILIHQPILRLLNAILDLLPGHLLVKVTLCEISDPNLLGQPRGLWVDEEVFESFDVGFRVDGREISFGQEGVGYCEEADEDVDFDEGASEPCCGLACEGGAARGARMRGIEESRRGCGAFGNVEMLVRSRVDEESLRCARQV